jgi:predicted DNA-binding transcriptional regulator AlpA
MMNSQTMNDKPVSPPVVLSIEQFCERYGLSRAMYYTLRERGEGPAEVRIGSRKIRITERAATEWESLHTHQPEADTQPTKKKPVK